MNGMIFNIQRFSIHDGPGIRTTVFLKGCNLRCKWCHNPEGFTMAQDAGLAGKLIGEKMDSTEIMGIVLRDRAFYENSGGGVTFSGGEPLLQDAFLLDMLKIAKENCLHTAIETAGDVNRESFEKILRYVDLFMYDIKHMNREKHREATQVSNERILANLAWLDQNGCNILVHLPIIPTVNDSIENMAETAHFLRYHTSIREVKLLPLHKLAGHKYENLGLCYAIKDNPDVTKEKLAEITTLLRSHDIHLHGNE